MKLRESRREGLKTLELLLEHPLLASFEQKHPQNLCWIGFGLRIRFLVRLLLGFLARPSRRFLV